jgi:hypothetical protein
MLSSHSVVALGLWLWFGILKPLAAVEEAVRAREAAATTRWLCFFACGVVALAPLACLPSWTPMRFELALAATIALGCADARVAEAVYARHLRPKLLAPLCARLDALRASAVPPPPSDAAPDDAATAQHADAPSPRPTTVRRVRTARAQSPSPSDDDTSQ